MLALSVSISTSSSPRFTSSPSDFSHLRIVPSSIESDRRGIETSAMAADYSAHWRTDAPVLARSRVHERGRGHGGEREREHRAAALARLDPDLAALALHDLAADREADARALEGLAVVQALEHLEHALAVLRVDPDAVVGHGDPPLGVVLALRRDPHPRAHAGAELEGVRDQVLQHLHEREPVAEHRRQRADADLRARVRH